MFSFFKSQSKVKKLQVQYEKKMAEAYLLSSINRTSSDEKIKEANEIQDQISALLKKEDENKA